jgi:hypothetical protein
MVKVQKVDHLKETEHDGVKTCILYERAKLVTCKHHNVNMKYKDCLLMKHRPYLLLYFQLFFLNIFQVVG